MKSGLFHPFVLLVLSAFLFLPLTAKASLINFLFTTSGDGNPGDTINGELIGLQNGSNEDPTQVLITQAPASLGLNASVANPYVLTVTNYLSSNAGGVLTSSSTGVYGLTVALVGGVETITTPLDLAFEDASGNGVGFNFFSTNLNGPGYTGALFNNVGDYAQTGFSGTTFTAVPEPHNWSLFLLFGMAGLVVLRKFRSVKLSRG